MLCFTSSTFATLQNTALQRELMPSQQQECLPAQLLAYWQVLIQVSTLSLIMCPNLAEI